MTPREQYEAAKAETDALVAALFGEPIVLDDARDEVCS